MVTPDVILAISLLLYLKESEKLVEVVAMYGNLILPNTTVKLIKLLPIGVIVKVRLVNVQLPKDGEQLVLLDVVN
jgi:hypothetical protein